MNLSEVTTDEEFSGFIRPVFNKMMFTTVRGGKKYLAKPIQCMMAAVLLPSGYDLPDRDTSHVDMVCYCDSLEQFLNIT